jgi:CDGSH-type Zn-finger protein
MAATVRVLSNGPLMVQGEVEVVDAEGKPHSRSGDTLYLCRCGASGRKPFCDGSHKTTGLRG